MMGVDFDKGKSWVGSNIGARDLIVVIPSAVEGPLTSASVSEISGAEAASHGLEVLRLRCASLRMTTE